MKTMGRQRTSALLRLKLFRRLKMFTLLQVISRGAEGRKMGDQRIWMSDVEEHRKEVGYSRNEEDDGVGRCTE
jgi:hypothetical protein